MLTPGTQPGGPTSSVPNEAHAGTPSQARPLDCNALLSRLGFVAVTTDLLLPEPAWLVDGLWPDCGVGFIGGPPKVGKTWIALEFAIAVATGTQFLGRPVTAPGRVLYFLGEDGLAATLARMDLLLRGRGLSRDALGGRLLMSEAAPWLDDQGTRDVITDLVAASGPTLVVLDPLTRFLSVAEESSVTEMRPVNNWIRQDLSRKGKTAVLIVHHTDKEARGLRGTGDLRALSEVTLLLGEKNREGRSRVAIEMRGAVTPKPFHVGLVEVSGGGRRIDGFEEGLPEADLAKRARALLEGRGDAGVTTSDAATTLHVRHATAKKALEDAGAVRESSNQPWVLPRHLRIPPAAAPAEHATSGPGKGPDSAVLPVAGKAPEGTAPSASERSDLQASGAREGFGSALPPSFPSQGGLIKTPGEEGGEEAAGSESPGGSA